MGMIAQQLTVQLVHFQWLMLILTVILHFIFAASVAKDAGNIQKLGGTTILVNGLSWAFATLVGGVLTAVVYWILHHSKLFRG